MLPLEGHGANLAAEVPSLAVSYLVCLEHGASRQPLATSKTRVDICWFTVGGQPMLEGKVIFQAMFPPEPAVAEVALKAAVSTVCCAVLGGHVFAQMLLSPALLLAEGAAERILGIRVL